MDDAHKEAEAQVQEDDRKIIVAYGGESAGRMIRTDGAFGGDTEEGRLHEIRVMKVVLGFITTQVNESIEKLMSPEEEVD